MRIETIEQLRKYLKAGFREGWANTSLYVASAEFDHINDPIHITSEPFIGSTIFTPDYTGIIWKNNYGNIQSRSLDDMNIPENHYNDWRCFTTLEEAEAYRSMR